MLNSVSFNPGNSMGILSREKGSVVVDGKTYKVKTVPYNNPLKCTLAQEYRDVVIINGKQYPVQKASDILASDKTKDVVVIDGKTYNVRKGGLGDLLPIGGILA